jgi:DNA-binding transcriptional LysR family regulator
MQLHNRQGNIPIALYRSFVTISELGSFTEAAQRLNVTQSAISVQMKRLQRLVGGDLFVKQAMGVGLSELGSMVEEYARRILVLNDQVMAMAGRASQKETVYLGIQSLFVRKTLVDVVEKCSVADSKSGQIICGGAPSLTEKLRAGYVDLALMLPPAALQRNVLAEWTERMVFVRAPHHRALAENEPVPLIHREGGLIGRRAMKSLDEHGVPYRVVFGATDLGTLVTAAEAGLGFLVLAERVLPSLSGTLVVAADDVLPEIPGMRAGVFHREGFDLGRHRQVVEAFLSVVRPPHPTPPPGGRPSRQKLRSASRSAFNGTNIHGS